MLKYILMNHLSIDLSIFKDLFNKINLHIGNSFKNISAKVGQVCKFWPSLARYKNQNMIDVSELLHCSVIFARLFGILW